jgi:hypothetical protein
MRHLAVVVPERFDQTRGGRSASDIAEPEGRGRPPPRAPRLGKHRQLALDRAIAREVLDDPLVHRPAHPPRVAAKQVRERLLLLPAQALRRLAARVEQLERELL